MLGLFIAVSFALALVVWAERHPPSGTASPVADLAAARRSPAAAAAAAAVEDLPRIRGFRPGDVIELEIIGPLPRPEDLRFDQVGHDARMLLDDLPALIFEGVPVRHLRPAQIRFRSPQAA
ncbi:hypothetical protein H9N28_15380 [Rhodobacter capsulatus]|uniref:hypothetical protein n=1 Tax=Rhodobacter capsulatus TaxID=1061 RepID=UPI0006DCBE46|nr:hypothetical protein [Rhodobacter capsulatus]KQB11648.1 hypothetical protein AP073_08500 [Rhodobacter capsulatus]KQB11765.1 hypothetical protein AP071_09705 [Rhodobacter capsulatus]PZX28632.1 hypothetical protein LY44_00383 [Rhodobacter capsulatus]QNR62908.1 hypothetical protein H9N28_15380 [Rhodobacter capsulatus]